MLVDSPCSHRRIRDLDLYLDTGKSYAFSKGQLFGEGVWLCLELFGDGGGLDLGESPVVFGVSVLHGGIGT